MGPKSDFWSPKVTFGPQKSLFRSRSHFWGPKVTFGVQKPFRRKITNGEEHAPCDRRGTGDPPRARLRGAGGRPARAGGQAREGRGGGRERRNRTRSGVLPPSLQLYFLAFPALDHVRRSMMPNICISSSQLRSLRRSEQRRVPREPTRTLGSSFDLDPIKSRLSFC